MAAGKRTVLITGCSAGSIGDALAREFAARDFRVFAASRRLETMESLARDGIETIKLNITNDKDIEEAAVEVAKRTGGSLDVLVNNAGIGSYCASIADSDMDKVRAVLNTNVLGHYAVSRAFIPLLIKSERGVVLFNSSIASVIPLPYNGAYAASKAALNALGDTLRVELAPFGVKVVNLLTGNIKSNLDTRPAAEEGLPEGSIYKPVESAYKAKIATYFDDAGSAEVYANSVVDEALRESPSPWFWSGPHSTIAWFLSTFAKRGFFPSGWIDLQAIWIQQARGHRQRQAVVAVGVVFLVIESPPTNKRAMASTSSSSSRAGSRTKKITGVPEPEIPIVVEEVDDPVESAEILQGVAEEEDGEESDEYELEDDSDSGEEYEEEDDDGPSLTALLLVNDDGPSLTALLLVNSTLFGLSPAIPTIIDAETESLSGRRRRLRASGIGPEEEANGDELEIVDRVYTVGPPARQWDLLSWGSAARVSPARLTGGLQAAWLHDLHEPS
ncbi:hypothetical protein HDZ31DRAFT_71058 [Schizophyllum fasciatum]